MRIAIVGSGPSATAALTHALSLNNIEVFLIDPSIGPGEGIPLNPEELSKITKKYLGSDHPYRILKNSSQFRQLDTSIPRSFAQGGLSLVWGATMLPFLQEDCDDWLVSPAQLVNYYKSVADFVWISGDTASQVNQIYPDFSQIGRLTPSGRFSTLTNKKAAKDLGVAHSRIAIRVSNNQNSGCILCNQCLTGCSYGHIWNSANYISTLELNHTTKVNGYVDSLMESGGKVQISIIGNDGTGILLEEFDKVFLGAGIIETFRILAKSELISSTQTLADSSISYVPFFSVLPFSSLASKSHTLTKVVFRLKHELPGRKAHLQLYSISQEIEEEITQRYPFLNYLPNVFRKFLLTFFAVGILYLPSELSPQIKVSLQEDGSVFASLSEDLISDSDRRLSMRKVIYGNLSKFLRLGIFPLLIASTPKDAGSGVHTGASIPMGTATDRLGRVSNDSNIHVLDASVLPDIPAGPITFTVMANALRICMESLR